MKYAHADGHGRVEIYNPFMGQRLTIDSSDYRSPQRFEFDPTVSVDVPPVAGTEGQKTAVYALALDGTVIYATHAAIPEFFEPPTVSGELVELDRHDLQMRRRVGVGLEPVAVVKHEASNRLFVVNRTGVSVSVIDALSFNVLATINFAGAGFIGAAVSQKFNRIYVTQPIQKRILVIDPTVPKELAPLMDLAVTGYVAVDEATDRLFVLVQNSANALLQDLIEFEINAEGHPELRRITVNNQVSVASEIAVDAERCYLLTADRRTPTTQRLLEIVDRATLTVTAQVQLPGDGLGVATSASQRVVYVTTSAELLTIDVTSLQVVHRRTLPRLTQATVVADERTGTAYYGGVGASTIATVGMTIDGLGS